MAGKDRVVAIGPPEEMLGLRSVGIEVAPAEGAEEVVRALRALADEARVRLVLVSESAADGAREAIRDLRRDGTAVLLVPSHQGARGLTQQWIKEAMEQSIGADVISER